MKHFACLYPVSQTPCVTCCSYTGTIACTSRGTGSELKVEGVDQLWYVCNANPCSSAPLHQATQQECVRDRASPTWLPLIPYISTGTRSFLDLTTPRSCLDLQATSFLRRCSVSSCVIAISCSILILSNKQEQFSHSFKQALLPFSSTHSAQSLKAGQIHPATCSGKPCAHQRHKSLGDFLVRNLQDCGRQHKFRMKP